MYLMSKYIKEKTDTIVLFFGEGYMYFHKAPSDAEADEESHRRLKDLYLFPNLRADCTTAAHGLELHVPFFDKYFTSYILSLPAANRCPKDRIEKYLLRNAFSGTNLLPEEVLWRPKEIFSDGVSSKNNPWYQVLQDKIEDKITDDMLANAATRFPKGALPTTKEACYYREIFEEMFPNCEQLTPYYWAAPEWAEPSA